MKAIIQAYSPEEIDRIARGEQTIKVCKTAPKLETPFKVYVYETKGATETPWVDEDGHFIYKGCGQVVGEFVCDFVEECIPDFDPYLKVFFNYFFERGDDCLTEKELRDYGNGLPLFGWHITEPKQYDKPKDLGEFVTPSGTGGVWGNYYLSRPPRGWQYVEELSND